MFDFVSSRHEAGSTIITTNPDFSRSDQSRGAHRAHIIATNGDSFRFEESLGRKETEVC